MDMRSKGVEGGSGGVCHAFPRLQAACSSRTKQHGAQTAGNPHVWRPRGDRVGKHKKESLEKEKREKMGKESLELIKTHGIETMVEKYLSIYQEAIKNNK